MVSAVENRGRALGSTYNVVDDEPARNRDIAIFIAQALGARSPMRMPAAIARLFSGADSVASLTTSTHVRNQCIKDELGWKAEYPMYRDGYRAGVEKWEVGGGK